MKTKDSQFKRELTQARKKIETLIRDGYVLLDNDDVSEIRNPEDRKSESVKCSCDLGVGDTLIVQSSMFDSGSSPLPISGGTEGLGYVPWGPVNALPNNVYRFAGALPYTAACLEYITNLTFGLGPRLMYNYSYWSNGMLKRGQVPFEDAGGMIAGRIADIQEKIAAGKSGVEVKMKEGDILPWSEAVAMAKGDYRTKAEEPVQKESEADAEDFGTLEWQLSRLKEDYREWERSMDEIRTFHENNDLAEHALKCIQDDSYLDIYFPTYGLSKGRPGRWDAKIVSVGHLPAACCRLEQISPEDNLIHYLYYSERWRTEASTSQLAMKDYKAWPVIMPGHSLRDLRAMVEKNHKTKVSARPTWVCCPCYYPSMLKPYYPQPKWYSLFPSRVIQYASTLIYDKATARKNATMWGKVIYVNLEYLEQLYKADEENGKTREGRRKIRTSLREKVNDFLQRRDNNGKTIMLDAYPSQDEKTMMKSIEIVDIPQNTNAAITKDELEELSSIICFTMGVDPQLVGCIPGKAGSTGGTAKREAHLLKELQMTPRQKILLRFYNNIPRFNGWDRHAEYIIQMPVLTTLDRNSTGIQVQPLDE